MALPAAPPATWLTRPRVVGTPLHWARHAAGLGASTAATGSAFAIGNQVSPWLHGLSRDTLLLLVPACAVMVAWSAVIGGLVGLVAPVALDRARGRVPLPAIAAAATGAGALAGAAAIVATLGPLAALSGGPFAPLAGLALTGAGFGAAVTTCWWLPFTLATVTGRRWPVTRVVGPTVSALVLALIVLGYL